VPPLPPEPAFDWESLLGVRGAAWAAGIALVLAAILFAKWSAEQGYFARIFTPVVRVVLMVVGGTGALVWAELGLRKGYRPTADALSGVGIVTLYAAWYSAHRVVEPALLGTTGTFIAMSVVTAVAAAIAVRRAALFTAILGVAGGLATPLLVASNVDRPVGFFGYLAVLNLGFLWVARRQGWAVITGLALAGTTLLEIAWTATRLNEDKLGIAVLAYALLGGLYLWHAIATYEDDAPASHGLGLAGASFPFVLAVLLAGDARFTAQWPVVLGYLALLDVAVMAAGLWRVRLMVPIAAVATLVACGLWPIANDTTLVPLAGPALVVFALTAAFNVLGRVDARRTGGERAVLSMFGLSGLFVALGLYVFIFAIVGPAQPAVLVLAAMALLILVLVERTTVDQAPLVLAAGAFGLGVLALRWFETSATEGAYVGVLSAPHVLAAVFLGIAIVRERGGLERDGGWIVRGDTAVLSGALVAYVGLHAAADRAAYSAAGPLFLLLGVDLLLVLTVAVRRTWRWIVPVAAAFAWLYAASWHVQYFSRDTAFVPLAAEVGIYLAFVLLPFVLTAWRPASWRTAIAAWLTSAGIGPAFFTIFRPAWIELWGADFIGVLAVGLAIVSVITLAGIGRVFPPTDDAVEARRRLNYLSLFAAIALAFVAGAIALQLQNQWLTIGLALEAAAVFWIFGLLPHPGLKYFGLGLFVAVALRLLFNPEVLRYEVHGARILNWLVIAYGVPVLCALAGAWLLKRAEDGRIDPPDYDWLAGDRTAIVSAVGGLGVVLLFWLINLEIFDFFAAGRYIDLTESLDVSRRLARDLTFSVAWATYALILLGLGIWRRAKGLRIASLIFQVLVVAKVFLYDLRALEGPARIGAFFGLGLSLIVVSLLNQRFIRRSQS
jgi:uncharacterized membrane protein